MMLFRRVAHLAVCLLPVAVLLLSGCAATFQPMGPMTQVTQMMTDTVVTQDGVGLPLRSWMPACSSR